MVTAPHPFERATEAAEFLRGKLGELPPVALVLGSGWDALAPDGQSKEVIRFAEIPGFAAPKAGGHGGTVSVLDTGAGPLLVQEGRLHCYEGLEPGEAAFPVFAFASGGVRLLVLLSAAGGLNPLYVPGDLVIVTDHIFLWGENPLRGLVEPGRSPHVPGEGMYSGRWQDVLEACLPPGTRCGRGIYAGVPGPSYETPAEARLLRVAGADVVGMSTAPEALAARYMGLEVAAMCCVANTILPVPAEGLSHDGVLEAVRRCARGMPGFAAGLAREAYMLL